MSQLVDSVDLIGKPILMLVSTRDVGSDGFVNNRCFVRIEERWLEIDGRGVDKQEDLSWMTYKPTECETIYPELIGLTITHVVVTEYLPTYALILNNNEILYCSDLGPPFQSFGPLHEQVGRMYLCSDFIDFWRRTPIEASKRDE